jgi:hypothetical protein
VARPPESLRRARRVAIGVALVVTAILAVVIAAVLFRRP